MIRIKGYDTPIEAARKIIEGASVYEYEESEILKAATKVLTGKEYQSRKEERIFTLEEIKEIADYLIVYYNAHKE